MGPSVFRAPVRPFKTYGRHRLLQAPVRLRVGAVAAETCLAATVGRWLAHARSYAVACFARAGVAQAENASCDAEGGEPRYKPPEPDKMAPLNKPK